MENDRFVLVGIDMVHCGWNCLTVLWPLLAEFGGAQDYCPKTANFLVAAAAHSNDRISFSTFQFCTSKPRIRLTVNKSSTCPIRICLQINFCPFSRSSLSTFILIYAERWECTKFLAPRRACIGCENACLHWNLTHVMWSAAWSQSNYISRKRTIRQA